LKDLATVQRPVNRDETATVIAGYAGISGRRLPHGVSTYEDVPRNHPAYDDINLTKHYRLTYGIGHGLFRPSEYMLRRDAARVVSRLDLVRDLRRDLPLIDGMTYTDMQENVIFVTPNYGYTTTIRRMPWEPSVISRPTERPRQQVEEQPAVDTRAVETRIDRLIEEERPVIHWSSSEEDLIRELEAELKALSEGDEDWIHGSEFERFEYEWLRMLDEEIDAQILLDNRY